MKDVNEVVKFSLFASLASQATTMTRGERTVHSWFNSIDDSNSAVRYMDIAFHGCQGWKRDCRMKGNPFFKSENLDKEA